MACVVPKKGAEDSVVAMVSKFILDMGLTHFAYRCAREKAITSMIDGACGILGRTGKLVKTDQDIADLDFPLAAVDDDEPYIVAAAWPPPPPPAGAGGGGALRRG